MNYVSKIDDSFVNQYKLLTPPFGPVGYVTYKRTYSRNGEEWWETVKRCCNGILDVGGVFTQGEIQDLYHYVFNLKCNFGGRSLWQLGTDVIRRVGADSLINCWFTAVKEFDSFMFTFNELMLGGGVGFSVLPEHVYELPRIAFNPDVSRNDGYDVDFIVPDNREGWVELLRKVFEAFTVNGRNLTFSPSCIRDRGKPIKTFGGIASGPENLVSGIMQIVQILKSRSFQKLRPIDCLDIMNIIGSIVVAGNVRRSAEIGIGDPRDVDFLNAKNWSKFTIPKWRQQSNNTCMSEDIRTLPEEFWDGYNGDGEPYGLLNLKNCREYGRLIDGRDAQNDPLISGANPCFRASSKFASPDGITTLSKLDVGNIVWSGQRWTKIIRKVSSGVKPTYKYYTRAGYFEGTENHKILEHGCRVEVGKAESIDVSRVGPINDSVVYDYQTVVDGLVLGDGSIHTASNNAVKLNIGKNDHDYFISEIKDYLAKQTNYDDYQVVKIKSTFKASELPHTYDRKVPDRFFYGNVKTVRSFLRGLYSANGSIVRSRITLKAASFDVIEQVQQMLSFLGIRSYYTTNRETDVKFRNGVYTCKQSYDLNISSDRKEFARQIGFIQKYKQEHLATLISEPKKKYDNNAGPKLNYEIVKKEYLGDCEVFDVTVEASEHTVWNSGLLVANCGEIPLANYEACNLAEIYLPNIHDRNEFALAAELVYKVNKTITGLPYSYAKSNEIIHRNRRVGVGITGYLQAAHFVDDTNAFNYAYQHLRDVDRVYSKLIGAPESVKLTTVKPSGTSSLLPGVTPGCHPAYSYYYIRRIQFASEDKLVELARKSGYHVEPKINIDNTRDMSSMVVDFPIATPDGTVTAPEMSAIEQLEHAKFLQTYWADNSVSVTVYYRPEEIFGIRDWLDKNYNEGVKSVSFLLHSGHGFKQAPYEEISSEKYNELISKCKPITQIEGTGEILESLECASGLCPIK